MVANVGSLLCSEDILIIFRFGCCFMVKKAVLALYSSCIIQVWVSYYFHLQTERVLVLQGDPVIPAFPDLHLAPASILKELAPYFQKVSAQVRQIGVPLPHELSPREASEYPLQQSCSAVSLFR